MGVPSYSGRLPQTIWVARLQISCRTADKISNRHGLQDDEIRDAVVCVQGLPFAWDDDPDRGLRALVRIKIQGSVVLVVLYPVDDPTGDVWNLGSAYRVNR